MNAKWGAAMISAAPTPEAIALVEGWLLAKHPHSDIRSVDTPAREVWLFRARDPAPEAPLCEVEIGYAAFQHHSIAEIVAALERSQVVRMWVVEPGIRQHLDAALVLRAA